MRAFAKNWLPVLFNAFISSELAERGPIGSAISAYAAIADAATVASFFRNVMQKLIKVQTPSHKHLSSADLTSEEWHSRGPISCLTWLLR